MRGLQKYCLGQYCVFWLVCWVLLSEMVLQCQVTATPNNHAIKHRDIETASEHTTVGHHGIGKPHTNEFRHRDTKKTKSSSGTTACMKNGKPKKKTITRRASGTNNTNLSNSTHPSSSPLQSPSQSSLPPPSKATTNPSVTTKTTDPSTTQYSPLTTTTTTTAPTANTTALAAVAGSPNEKKSVVQTIPGQTIQCDSMMPYVVASLIGFLAAFLLTTGCLLRWRSIRNKMRQQKLDEFQEYNFDHMILP